MPRICLLLVASAVFLWAGSSGSAKDISGEDLTGISLEELMDIEVTSVSRKDQRLADTAAAVYVVTNEDIRRSGATSIPEALRMVPGLHVARIDANKWAVSARGFNARYANKMLVLIDGRSLYNNAYTGVFWEHTDVLLEDVERIEVVRGPGATMWGANAVNAVINIITKTTEDTQGLLVSASSGSVENANLGVRYGGRVGDNLQYRVWGKYFNRGPMRTSAGDGANDRWRSGRGGARIDWQIGERDQLTIHGDGYSGSASQLVYPSFPASMVVESLAQTAEDAVDMSGAYIVARWERRLSDRSDIAVQWHADDLNRNELFGGGSMHVMDFDFQHHYAATERHDLMWGGGYRRMSDDIRAGLAEFIPAGRSDNVFSAFLQDDIAIVRDRLILTLGSKLQHNDYSGWEVQPSARVLWSFAEKRALWAAVSRAVRTPARADHDLRTGFELPAEMGFPMRVDFLGNPDLVSESVIAYEGGYRHRFGQRFSFDLAVFYNQYDRLANAEASEPRLEPGPMLYLPITFVNSGEGSTYGAEVATTTSLSGRWKLYANYSWMHENLSVDRLGADVVGLSRDPKHQVQLRSNIDFTDRLSFDASAYYVSRLPMGVSSYVRLDGRVGYRFNGHMDFSVILQNLLDDRHLEFIPEDYVVPFEIRRAIFARMTWRF